MQHIFLSVGRGHAPTPAFSVRRFAHLGGGHTADIEEHPCVGRHPRASDSTPGILFSAPVNSIPAIGVGAHLLGLYSQLNASTAPFCKKPLMQDRLC